MSRARCRRYGRSDSVLWRECLAHAAGSTDGARGAEKGRINCCSADGGKGREREFLFFMKLWTRVLNADYVSRDVTLSSADLQEEHVQQEERLQSGHDEAKQAHFVRGKL